MIERATNKNGRAHFENQRSTGQPPEGLETKKMVKAVSNSVSSGHRNALSSK